MKTRAARPHTMPQHTRDSAPGRAATHGAKMKSSHSIRLAWLVLLAVLASACAPAWSQDDRCGAGKDLVVQALERITPQSNNDAFEDALQLLKHAVQECSELGDAWYYRSLVEQRLGHDALAKYAMDKARFNGSEALQQGLNPLVLATPAGRGIRSGRGAGESCPAPARTGPAEAAGRSRRSGRWWWASAASPTADSAAELYDRGRKFLCRRADRSGNRAFSRKPCPCADR